MTDNFKKITQEQSVAIGQNKAVNILKAINKEKKKKKTPENFQDSFLFIHQNSLEFHYGKCE